MRPVVVAPQGAAGARPLALFLHGRHATCYRGEEDSNDWPCPEGYAPIPSHRGCLQALRLLAAQGYVTAASRAGRRQRHRPAGAGGKSRAPSSCSSFAIWWLNADWTTKHRSAARVKLPNSATAATYRSCWSSTHQ
jgi:hypothetical protein